MKVASCINGRSQPNASCKLSSGFVVLIELDELAGGEHDFGERGACVARSSGRRVARRVARRRVVRRSQQVLREQPGETRDLGKLTPRIGEQALEDDDVASGARPAAAAVHRRDDDHSLRFVRGTIFTLTPALLECAKDDLSQQARPARLPLFAQRTDAQTQVGRPPTWFVDEQ